MKSYDFEYDGITLSDLGYVVCSFDSDDMETVSNGSEITFNTTATFYGAKYQLTSTSYDECLETTFQICKDSCSSRDEYEITVVELRQLMRWLNRKGFHKFKFLDDEYVGYYFEGSFNVSRIEVGNILVGLELTLITNRPFALMEEVSIIIENDSENGKSTIYDSSDEEGYIYPHTEITIAEAGDLSIYNEIVDRTTYIGNCTAGEIITMDYPIISTSDSAHEIQNDFNWNFFRIANYVGNSENNLSISIPCTIALSYSPIAKIGL